MDTVCWYDLELVSFPLARAFPVMPVVKVFAFCINFLLLHVLHMRACHSHNHNHSHSQPASWSIFQYILDACMMSFPTVVTPKTRRWIRRLGELCSSA
jgi:hypothetical protein